MGSEGRSSRLPNEKSTTPSLEFHLPTNVAILKAYSLESEFPMQWQSLTHTPANDLPLRGVAQSLIPSRVLVPLSNVVVSSGHGIPHFNVGTFDLQTVSPGLISTLSALTTQFEQTRKDTNICIGLPMTYPPLPLELCNSPTSTIFEPQVPPLQAEPLHKEPLHKEQLTPKKRRSKPTTPPAGISTKKWERTLKNREKAREFRERRLQEMEELSKRSKQLEATVTDLRAQLERYQRTCTCPRTQ